MLDRLIGALVGVSITLAAMLDQSPPCNSTDGTVGGQVVNAGPSYVTVEDQPGVYVNLYREATGPGADLELGDWALIYHDDECQIVGVDLDADF